MRHRGGFDDGDEPALKSRRSTPDAELDITPMIDVTFLLLIFFMVTSTMQASPDLDVPVAEHGRGVETREATVIRIVAPGLAGQGPPQILLGNSDDAEIALEGVRREVENGMKQNRREVIIKADREVPHGFVQQVAREVTAVKGVKFYVGVRDKR